MHIHVNFYHEISIAKQGFHDGLMQYLVFDQKKTPQALRIATIVPFCHFSRSYIQKLSHLVDVCSKLNSTLISLLILGLVTHSLKKKKKDSLDLQLNISEEFDNL